MTCDSFDVVVVPFPFTDREQSKRRPALVLSSAAHFNSQSGHVVLAMITSAKNSAWPGDVKIQDLKFTGLSAESLIRMKLFTLDERLILKVIGRISAADRVRFKKSFAAVFRNLK